MLNMKFVKKQLVTDTATIVFQYDLLKLERHKYPVLVLTPNTPQSSLCWLFKEPRPAPEGCQ